jgi:large repetitive protein
MNGTGGPSGTTEFGGPTGVAVDANGNVYGAETNNHRIRKISGPVAPPTVTANTTLAYANGTALTVTGTGFDASTPSNNTVTLSSGATGTVTAATATSLTVAFGTKPVAGLLTVIVTNPAGNSGAAVQVASVFPIITSNIATVIAPSTSLTINGFGFSPTPGNNTVSLSSGSGVVTASTPTQLTLTGVTGLTLGALTAGVESNNLLNEDVVQVATVVHGPATFAVADTSTTTQSAPVNTAFVKPLAIGVRDAVNNPVPNHLVTFIAPGTGASGLFANATATITVATNVNGVASAVFTANGIGGTYAVTASATGEPNASYTLTNIKTSQTLGYTSTKPTPRVGDTYTPTATATSGLPVAITIDPTSSTVCTLTAGLIQFGAVGTCTINADQPGNESFLSGTRVQQSVTVTAAPVVASTATTASTPTSTTTTTTVVQLAFPVIPAGSPSSSQTSASNANTGSASSASGSSGSSGTGAESGGSTTTTLVATTAISAGSNSATPIVTTTTQPAPAPATPIGTPSDTAKQFDPAGVFTINFAPRSPSLSTTSKATIANVAKTYKTLTAGSKIVISAHTTKTATKRERDLATKRANTVSKALKTSLGKTVTTNGLRITVDTKTDNPTNPTVAQTNRITIQTTK